MIRSVTWWRITFTEVRFVEVTFIMYQVAAVEVLLQWFLFGGRSDPIPGHDLTLPGFTMTLRHTTLGRTPLDEWSARRRDLYLTTHSTQKGQTDVTPAGFEPETPASQLPQTRALAWPHWFCLTLSNIVAPVLSNNVLPSSISVTKLRVRKKQNLLYKVLCFLSFYLVIRLVKTAVSFYLN
jgi:hypothetical protein